MSRADARWQKARMDCYEKNSDRDRHPGFDVETYVEMQCDLANTRAKLPWWKQII